MKLYILPALILLTQLDGEQLWVESTHITVIRQRTGGCASGTKAMVAVGQKYLCVRETPEQIRQMMEKAK